jgi:DNA polymerase III epsilon subunit-like protein
MSRRFDALFQARALVRVGDWVVYDAETCGLYAPIISYAVCAPDGTILGQGLVKPTQAISPEAQAIHGMSEADLQDAPTFLEAWPHLSQLLEGKAAIVAYNAPFDESCLSISAAPYFCFLSDHLYPWVCAMRLAAVILGEWSSYWQDFEWEPLSAICKRLGIELTEPHVAAADAQATAKLLQKLAELADQELPLDYHLPREVPCAGGCDRTRTHEYEEEGDGTWWCDRCAVRVGLFHVCPRCQRPEAIVRNANLEERCGSCETEVKLEQGLYHLCAGCDKVIKALESVQKYHNARCQRRAYRRKREESDWTLPEGATPVYISLHQFEEVKTGPYKVRCTVCQQQWRSYSQTRCPGVVTYRSWSEVPERFVTWTELQRRRLQTSRALPSAAVRILKSPYFRYLFDSEQATPRLVSPARQAATLRQEMVRRERYTCARCQTYQQRRREQEAFHVELHLCDPCYEGITAWNKQIAWARERLAGNALVCQATYHSAPLEAKATLRDVLILRLDGTVVYQAEEFDPAIFFPLLLEHDTVVSPDFWEHLYYVCPDQQRYPYWTARHSGIAGGLPVVQEQERLVNVTLGRDSIYRRPEIPDPIGHLCARWHLAIDPQASTAEKMRQLITSVAAASPLEWQKPEMSAHESALDQTA